MTARQKVIEEWLKVGPRYPRHDSREWACFHFAHIVLDDDNTNDGCIQWCIKEGETNLEHYDSFQLSDEVIKDTLELLRSLLLIPEEDDDY